MPPKRPIRNVFGNDDDDGFGADAPNGTPPKKPRADASRTTMERLGGPPSTTPGPASRNAVGGSGENTIQAQVAAAKARAHALMSAMQNKRSTSSLTTASSSRPASVPVATSWSSSRSAPVGSAAAGPSTSISAAPETSTTTRPSAAVNIQAQLEAARAKVQAQIAALNKKPRLPAETSTSRPSSSLPPTNSNVGAPPTSSLASASKAPTGIHPLLLSNHLPYQPKESTSTSSAVSTSYVKGKSSVASDFNPYLQASRELAAESSSEKPKHRSMHKGFQFHKPGRHVREAEELRREQQMEQVRKRIEESAHNARLKQEGSNETRLLKPAPPEIEWWDSKLVCQPCYDDVPDVGSQTIESMLEAASEGNGAILLFGDKSPIDHYVQHPIPLRAPWDHIAVRPRALMLTKREQRKLRRQRRAAEQQDKRDRIKMGLLPPEPPKVKLSNLMRVLTSEAVSDPTKIEARVRREIAARKDAHERQNAERKLTPEQRRDKQQRSKQIDETKGIYCHVYKVKHLISPRHKFKLRRNALDHALTGVVIFHPTMALIVVEGSGKALKQYKRLMTVRIDWTDPADPTAPESADKQDPDLATATASAPVAFKHLTTSQENVDWSTNTCQLIFEGPIRQRYWSAFRAHAAPTDQAARDALGDAMQGYWDLATRADQSLVDPF